MAADSLVHVLQERAKRCSGAAAFTFLADAEGKRAELTYQELDARARVVAAHLQKAGLEGERVVLLYPPGLPYLAAFFGCLYANVVAVPAYPPPLRRPAPRLAAIVEDASPAAAMTTGHVLRHLDGLLAHHPRLRSLRWISDEEVSQEEWSPPRVSSGSLAMLQYTSGSTASPKGVALTHGNLLHNLEVIRTGFGLSSEDRGVFWLPPYHDMGLIGGILTPVFIGFPATLMSPTAFLRSPLRWLGALSTTRGTVSGGPNFAYELCVERTSPEQRASLDLSHWKVAFNGAEPVRASTLDRFVAAFQQSGFAFDAFLPCYGLAESTLLVSGRSRAKPVRVAQFSRSALEQGRALEGGADARPLVSCGVSSASLLIVDPEQGTVVGPGRVGEIWITGESVASGYWKESEESARTFGARLAGSGAGPFLRTGDLAFRFDDELFIAGRIKDLIIVRGRNHFPQDLERTAESSHSAIRPGCVAAFVRDASEGEWDVRVVIAAEVDRHTKESDAIREAVSVAVAAEHGVSLAQVVLLQTGALPRTSSGKVQRYACRELLERGELERSALNPRS